MSLVLREKSCTGITTELEIEKIYYQKKTEFQDVLIGETSYGRTLFLDSNSQSSACDEGIYHSTLVHPALFTHPNPRRVLIGGGGEGATLREVLRHPQVETAIMVDIDGEAVAAFKEHLPTWHCGSFEDPRAEVLHDDVRRWLKEIEPGSLDVIILDLSDPILEGPSALTFTKEFYTLCHRALAPGGIVAGQAGEFDYGVSENFRALLTTIGEVMPHRRPYKVGMPFFCCDWGFFMASEKPLPLVPPDLEERYYSIGGEEWGQWYDPEGHRALMWLPRQVRQMLAEPGRILTDTDNLAEV